MKRIKKINQLSQMLKKNELSLQQIVQQIIQQNHASRFFVIIDQFEELYTLCQDDVERQRFLDELLQLIKFNSCLISPAVTLVITLRADFCGQAYSSRPFTDALQDAELILGPMNREELQEAIEKPAAKQGVEIEEGLTERLLKDLENQPGNLPLLEFALYQLWGRMKNG
jgi:hypothetical protein